MIHVLYAEDDKDVARYMQDLFEANSAETELEVVETGQA